jgi:hypothetical protein
VKDDKIAVAVAQKRHVLNTIKKWSSIYPYVIRNGHTPASNSRLEAKHKRHLTDWDTYIYLSLIYLQSVNHDEDFTIRGLAANVDGQTEASVRAASAKITRLMDVVCGTFKLVVWTNGYQTGSRACVFLAPSELLMNFFNNEMYTDQPLVLT